MSYSDKFLKGRIGYNSIGWPLVLMERAKSDKPNTPVLCEVWGFEHECGSIYAHEIILTEDLEGWRLAVKGMQGDPDERYFKGELLVATPVV